MSPLSEKVGGHIPRVPHQIAPMPMHADETPFVLSPFWTSPPLLQITGNSRSCKSMILDFTSLSHWSTCMLEVAQQLTPVSGISCGTALTPMRTL